MFNAKPEQSQALNDQVDRERVALADIKTDQDRKLYGNAMVVQAFNQIAQGKMMLLKPACSLFLNVIAMTLSIILPMLQFAARRVRLPEPLIIQ
jgi:hypothetical protein